LSNLDLKCFVEFNSVIFFEEANGVHEMVANCCKRNVTVIVITA
jgi:hypothetical protein